MYQKTGGYGYTYAKNPQAVSTAKPTFNVTVKKSRLKVFKDDNSRANVFMEDGEEFELELFNPRSNRISARIYINGSFDGEIVLRPGERIYLERFVSNDKRLVFETYDVEEEAASATVSNGVIVVEFTDELELYVTTNPWSNWNWNNGTVTIPATTPYWYTINTGTMVLGTTTSTIASNNTTTANAYFTSTGSGFETGRIEGGDESDQVFNQTNYVGSTVFQTDTVKIWPMSHRPVDVKKKRKCHECKSKVRHTDSYCSSCGCKL